MDYPNFNEETILRKKGFKCIIGLDEVGRGPLAGPVVAGAVLINNYNLNFLKGIKDSKKLSEKQRLNFFKIITKSKNIKWGIGIVSEKVIDKINILEATKLAMISAIDNLVTETKNQKPIIKNIDYLLIDGNFILNLNKYPFIKNFSQIKQKSIIKGDQKVISISVASIVAKVTRDKIMEKYHEKYPEYEFLKNKGYGTKLHFKILKKIGICPIHRKSFSPINKF